MSTALSIYERMVDPVAAIDALGMIIAKSKVITCETFEQGKVFAWECLVRRTPPLMLAERYHVIFGKLSMKAEAMLDGLIRAGGKYRVICRTPDKAEIEITIDGQTQNFSLTFEEAQQEPFAYEGKEGVVVDALIAAKANPAKNKMPKLKDKYATPRARMQMMWARVVSDGVRVMCPSVNSGVYTPEEVEDCEESGVEPPKTKGKKAEVEKPVAANPSADDGVIDGEFVVTEVTDTGMKYEPIQPSLPAGTTEPQFATTQQLRQIDDLLEKLNTTPEGREKILHKRGVNSFRSLTIKQAEDLILGAAKMIVAAKNKPVAEPLPPAGPCSVEQVLTAQRRLTELKQVNPPAFGNFVDWLKSKGKKIEQLSARDCDGLIAAANDVKLMDAFFAKSLEEWQPAATDAKDKPVDAATTVAADTASVPFETSSSKN